MFLNVFIFVCERLQCTTQPNLREWVLCDSVVRALWCFCSAEGRTRARLPCSPPVIISLSYNVRIFGNFPLELLFCSDVGPCGQVVCRDKSEIFLNA